MMELSQVQIDKMVDNELQLLARRELDHINDIKFPPFSILFIVLFSLFVFIGAFIKIKNDLYGLAITNNQILINNEIFKHSEQIAGISYWFGDIKENRLSFSNNLYRLLGCKPNEFEPTFENFTDFIHPDDRHKAIEANDKAMKQLLPTMIDFRIIRKDGVVRNFRSIGKVITDNFGTSFSIGINADVTEQHDKDRLLGEKLADLERSNKQLSAFNHIASHDLQEPLRKVQTFISRIREVDASTIPDKVKEYLAGIEKATVRMQKFIMDLLVYSRANKAEKRFIRADLNEILENAKRDLSQRIEEKNVIINTTSLLPKLNVISFQIHQLFINLISNSIKYSKPEINPIITIKTKIIKGKDIPGLPSDIEKRYYKISFSDNGIGFDQQYAEQIFTLFFRLHSNKEYSGTGIGLAICKVIVENHKGFIVAEGIPGVGSTIIVYLPV
jgi:signal transduction histidine kinase